MALLLETNHPHMTMPFEALLMPELEPMGVWARLVHEILLEVDPQRMEAMANDGSLNSFLNQQQDRLSAEARQLEQEWRTKNPLSSEDQQQRAAWHNQAKLYAREVLTEEIRRSYHDLKTA